jgi:Tfp pilus assembly protein PilZ
MKGNDRYRVDNVSCRLGDRRYEIVNLSVGGLFVACEEPPPAGQSVSLEVRLPRHEDLTIVGLVSWVNEREKPRVEVLPPGFGIKIVRIAFADKMALLAFLREVDPSALRKG